MKYPKEKTKFEKRFDAFCYAILILALLYFGGRFIAGVYFGI